MLIALDLWLGPASELVLVGGAEEAANQEAISTLQQSYLPRSVTAYRSGTSKPGSVARSAAVETLFAGRTAAGAEPRIYVCENFTCQVPVKGAAAIKAAIARL